MKASAILNLLGQYKSGEDIRSGIGDVGTEDDIMFFWHRYKAYRERHVINLATNEINLEKFSKFFLRCRQTTWFVNTPLFGSIPFFVTNLNQIEKYFGRSYRSAQNAHFKSFITCCLSKLHNCFHKKTQCSVHT